MTRLATVLLALILCCVFAASAAMATPPPTPVAPPDTRDVTFRDADVVDVERLEPTAEMIEWLKERERESLIRLRWHFVPQIVRSADQI